MIFDYVETTEAYARAWRVRIERFANVNRAYFTSSGSSGTSDSSLTHGIYNLYDRNGQLVVYDNSKTYTLKIIQRYNGELIGGGGYYLVNRNGYLAFEQSNYGYIYPYVVQYLAL